MGILFWNVRCWADALGEKNGGKIKQELRGAMGSREKPNGHEHRAAV